MKAVRDTLAWLLRWVAWRLDRLAYLVSRRRIQQWRGANWISYAIYAVSCAFHRRATYLYAYDFIQERRRKRQRVRTGGQQ